LISYAGSQAARQTEVSLEAMLMDKKVEYVACHKKGWTPPPKLLLNTSALGSGHKKSRKTSPP